MKATPIQIRYVSLGVALLSVVPVSLGAFTGIYLWMSPFILLNSAFALKGLTLLNILGIAVLVAALLKDRWFCRYVCPTGVLCDSVARLQGGRVRFKAVPLINRPLALASLLLSVLGIPLLAFLDPINAFYNAFNFLHLNFSIFLLLNVSGLSFILFMNVISPSSWCSRICPLGGLQLLLTDIRMFVHREKKRTKHSYKRRQLLVGATSFGLGLAFLYAIRQAKTAPLFRPPGSLTEDRLKTICIRCGNCMKACPTDIIRPLTDPENLTGLMTPELDFSISYCLPECTLCGDVCPSGAITSFDRIEKQQLFIGRVQIDLDRCLLTHNQECNQCKVACAYDAIKMERSRSAFTTYPEVNDRCVGCAACKIVCPANAVEMENLT